MSYIVKQITEQYASQVNKLVHETFSKREPMAIALNFMDDVYDKPASKTDLDNYRKGFVIGALDGDKLIGFETCKDKGAEHESVEDTQEGETEDQTLPDEFFAAFELLNKPLLEEPYKNKKLFHIWTLGVDEAYVGRGIAVALVRKTVEVAVSKGFDYAYAECTNILSEKAMHKNKFSTIYKYAWKDCGLKIFEQIEGDFALTVKKLR